MTIIYKFWGSVIIIKSGSIFSFNKNLTALPTDKIIPFPLAFLSSFIFLSKDGPADIMYKGILLYLLNNISTLSS